MTEVLTVAEMYRADSAAMAGGAAGVELMDRAGRAVAEAVRVRTRPGPVLILCGPGNNGGDGFVAARHLAEAGWPVRLALLGDRTRLKGDAAHHAALWTGPVETLTDAALPGLIEGVAVAVDALFGAGLARPLGGAARAAVEAVNASGVPVAAVDVPSGLSGDTGEALGGLAARAAVTVTFFRKKPGHLLLPGRVLCGEVTVADIGIPDGVLGEIAPKTAENGPGLWAASVPRRRLDSHKYDFGHALVVGGAAMTGAGRLAARAALRVGAGLVTVACTRETLPVYALSGASVITAPIDEEGAFERLIADERKNAVLLGPGNGVGEETANRVLAVLGARRAAVLDADAISSFEGRGEALFGAVGAPCVLTPHEGEFRRLFPDLEGDKLARARAAAQRSRAVVLLKGADTVVADPDGRAAINANAPPALATAGTGDVLAGLAVGLLAQGMAPFEAACAAAWLHGEAGAALGTGLIAEDLPEVLPKILRRL
jgi:NAD(P)H-hydrate epimerase